ncbi:MAG: LysM peptidoglycan-binding domain-containing protein, partial [Aestuariivirgaceae bacterium]
ATTDQAETGQQVATDTSTATTDQTQTAAVTPSTTAEQQQASAAKTGRVVIQPGNNLWNISRVIYGSGVEYSVIYEANKEQIRNPNLIYPGQIFSTPGAAPPEEIDPDQREPLTSSENATQ